MNATSTLRAHIGQSPAPPAPAQRSFRAMNTAVAFFAMDLAAGPAFDRAEAAMHAFEARFSRFLPGSELSALNRDAGMRVRVSAAMFALLELCAEMHERTGGAFNPAILPALEASGYDRSFPLVDPDAPARPAPLPPVSPFDQVRLRPASREVWMPGDMRLDLGGIGKGYAVEQALALLGQDALVDAGGDIAARGHGPDGDGWVVAIASPDQQRDLAVVRLRGQAIATSTTARRRWRRGGAVRHHIIDPRTGASAAAGLAQVSVIAPSAVDADVFAKCALILGERDGAALLAPHGYAALFVRDDGACAVTPNWPSGSHQPEGELI